VAEVRVRVAVVAATVAKIAVENNNKMLPGFKTAEHFYFRGIVDS